uniref:long-chain-fatty-acid--CoA ligase n=1 Tax=Phallusia mammillata TaxID=59560 RepID=A0A6F9D6H5_9ASCI|nr:long-chain-fatty-acid--CoA ligase 1-like [Phallusia mammillata]
MSDIMEKYVTNYLRELDVISWIGLSSIAFATFLWWLKKSKEGNDGFKCDVDPKKQSVHWEKEDGVRASPLMTGEPLKSLVSGVETLHDNFLHGFKLSEGGPCVGWRPGPDQGFKWITYQQVLDRVQHFGSGLLLEGATSDPSQFIGIFSQNRVEWKVVEQACNSYSMVIVPLYDTLGPESVQHIINQCQLNIVVVDNCTKATTLLTGVKEDKYKVKLIVVIDDVTDDVKQLSEETGVKVVKMAEVEERGKNDLKDFVPPKATDLHTVCYTSGTTGLPKGAMLSHRNVIANFNGAFAIGRTSFLKMGKDDVHISYLPLAHMMERVVAAQVYSVGASIGFFQGDVKLLLGDVATLRPTIFPMVPRLINKFYDKIWAGASQSFIKKFLLEKAVNAKLAKLKQGIVTRNTIWDKLVFGKIQNMMGGRIRLCITGAAPVSIDVINFMRVALGIPFSEGYGQTEATAAISITLPGDYHSSSVGTPVLCNVIKLVDVPEKNYFVKDNKGEVCVKGTNVFQGYYRDEEKTKQAFDEDGWLHTGDVGMWLPSGALKIIDRKKHIFKLAQGEYIAPEKMNKSLSNRQLLHRCSCTGIA